MRYFPSSEFLSAERRSAPLCTGTLLSLCSHEMEMTSRHAVFPIVQDSVVIMATPRLTRCVAQSSILAPKGHARAKQVLPHNNWEFIEAGAMDEFTTRRNRAAFEDITIRPRFLRDISQRDLSTTVLGTEISFPVMISPAGGHMNAHPEGELATARGAGKSNIQG